MGSSYFPIVVASVAIIAYVLVKDHFEVLPHERDLDTSSWWVSKLAHVVTVKPFPTNTTFGIYSGRLSYNLLTRLSDRVNLWREPELRKMPFEEFSLSVPHSYASEESCASLTDTIKLRVYNHLIAHSWRDGSKRPVLLWFHGGGCVVGSMEQDHVLSLQLAKETGFIVVNVDYRLAPEHVFPTAAEDSFAALEWVLRNVERFGGDKRRIVIGGESAGGNMAAAVTSKYLVNNPAVTREASPIVGLFLVYPALAPFSDPNDPEVALYANTNGLLPLETIENFRNIYAGTSDLSVRNNFLFAPLLTPETALQRYPPTQFILAKYDVLTKESTDLSRKLTSLGVPADILLYNSTIHAFFGKEIISPVGRSAVTESCRALLDLLKLGSR